MKKMISIFILLFPLSTVAIPTNEDVPFWNKTIKEKAEPKEIVIDLKKARRPVGRALDLNLELKYGVYPWGSFVDSWISRIRFGSLLASEPWYFSGGMYLEANLGDFNKYGIGLQFQLVHLWSGLWGQVGIGGNQNTDFVSHIACGYSIFGVEYQNTDGSEHAVFLKMEIPLGILFYGLSN
jgi:hypothetical protein